MKRSHQFNDDKEDINVQVALVKQALVNMDAKIDHIASKLEKDFITRQEVDSKFKIFEERYKLVRSLVFSAAGAVLGASLVTLINFFKGG